MKPICSIPFCLECKYKLSSYIFFWNLTQKRVLEILPARNVTVSLSSAHHQCQNNVCLCFPKVVNLNPLYTASIASWLHSTPSTSDWPSLNSPAAFHLLSPPIFCCVVNCSDDIICRVLRWTGWKKANFWLNNVCRMPLKCHWGVELQKQMWWALVQLVSCLRRGRHRVGLYPVEVIALTKPPMLAHIDHVDFVKLSRPHCFWTLGTLAARAAVPGRRFR